MELFTLLAIILGCAATYGYVYYFWLKRKFENHEEVWNGRLLFSDTRIVKKSDINASISGVILVTLLFIAAIVMAILYPLEMVPS